MVREFIGINLDAVAAPGAEGEIVAAELQAALQPRRKVGDSTDRRGQVGPGASGEKGGDVRQGAVHLPRLASSGNPPGASSVAGAQHERGAVSVRAAGDHVADECGQEVVREASNDSAGSRSTAWIMTSRARSHGISPAGVVLQSRGAFPA
jgi:hypothetical protein